MAVRIGHASIGENNKINGGEQGDQTGKEVCIRDWWNGGWDLLLRPKTSDVANRMAIACETLCNSNLVGYDQYNRNSLWDELSKVGFDASKLAVKCETDCSAFMAVCAMCAGVEVTRVKLYNGIYNAPVTSTMETAFILTGQFEAIKDKEYLVKSAYLKRGDILVRRSGHTVMVLDNANKLVGTENIDPALHRDESLTGSYICKAFALTFKVGAGEDKRIIGYLMNGEKVENYGYYNIDSNGTRWLYVLRKNGRLGYASERYLEKVEE